MSQSDEAGEITRLLRAHHRGDGEAFDRLVPLVYERMRRIAHGQLGGRRPGGAFDTIALVHETYMQLAVETGVDWQDRSHFFAICARAMRRLVVDEVRHRRAKKRGWAMAHLTLRTDLDVDVHTDQELVLAVDRAVERLAAFNERLARVVECRSFAGMTDEETARALGTSVRTAQRDWTRARAWLRKELEGGTGEGQILARRK